MPPETLSPSPLAMMLDRDAAAEYLGLKPATLAFWAHVGKYRDELPYALIGKKAFYRRADLDAWLASRFPA